MSFMSKVFGFEKAQHNVRTEILAGLTTFLTMAYILAVNPGIFSALPGMPAGSVFTATALAAVCPRPRYGLERILRVYRLPRYGQDLAVCTDGRIH
jgi:xanthine/uracil/vitamin C permease (AzgA family)